MNIDKTRCPAGYVHHSWRDVTDAIIWPFPVSYARRCAACYLCVVTLRPAAYQIDAELRIRNVTEDEEDA